MNIEIALSSELPSVALYLLCAAIAVFLVAVGRMGTPHTTSCRDGSAPQLTGLKWWDLLPILVLTLLVGSRQNVGTDTPVYASLFEALDTTSLQSALSSSELEPLYVGLSYFIKVNGWDERALFLAAAMLAVIPSYVAIRRLCVRPELGLMYYVLLGFYGLSFNIVRQAIAMGLLLLAYSFLRTRMTVCLLLLLAAVGFHFTAVVPVVVLLTFAILPRAARLPALIISLVVTFLGLRQGLLIELLEENDYAKYLTETEGLGRHLLLLAFISLSIFQLLATKKLTIEVAMPIVGLLFLYVGLEFVAVGRLGQYFLLFIIVSAGNLQQFKLSRASGLAVAISAFMFFVVQTLTAADLVPYESWLLSYG